MVNHGIFWRGIEMLLFNKIWSFPIFPWPKLVVRGCCGFVVFGAFEWFGTLLEARFRLKQVRSKLLVSHTILVLC